MTRVSKNKREDVAEVLPLRAVLSEVIREDLREFVFQQGMIALQGILEEERTRICGAPYERSEHEVRRAGSAPGELVLGGRKVKVKRPRARDSNGEVALDSYRCFAETDPLDERALEQMVIGVSTTLGRISGHRRPKEVSTYTRLSKHLEVGAVLTDPRSGAQQGC